MNLTGNTVLITGGGSGIGLELARQMVERNNLVIAVGRNSEKLRQAKKEIPALNVLRCDITQKEDLKNLVAVIENQFNQLNILINNAGHGQLLNLMDYLPHADIYKEIRTNLEAPILLTNSLLPILKTQPESAIINVTSALAFMPHPSAPIYSASKAGLRSYTISLRTQLEKTRVRVFELSPPATQTEMIKKFGQKKNTKKSFDSTTSRLRNNPCIRKKSIRDLTWEFQKISFIQSSFPRNGLENGDETVNHFNLDLYNPFLDDFNRFQDSICELLPKRFPRIHD